MVSDGLTSPDFKKTYHRMVAHSQVKIMEMVIIQESLERKTKGNGDRHY